eukprot:GSChrysophyteH1.ASY1.ANO1.3254.1 assembled CDS
MSNFLAGIGGVWGAPMWAFYVNRGQALTSFGVRDKNGGIGFFETAEKAYQTTPYTAFRTFLKAERSDGKCFNHQPFFPDQADSIGSKKITRDMHIGSNEVEIVENNKEQGLKTSVLYTTVADQSFPALIRKVTFTNTDTSTSLGLQIVDGLSKIEPAGTSNAGINAIGRTLEAFMKGQITQPFFHITQNVADSAAAAQVIKDGHFAIAFMEDNDAGTRDHATKTTYSALPFIVDPTIVFGEDTSLMSPASFFQHQGDLDAFLMQPQTTTSRTPCAYAATNFTLSRNGGSKTFTMVIGHAESLDEFITKISPQLRKLHFSSRNRKSNTYTIDAMTNAVKTETGSQIFDSYVKQNYLDNILRGGYPASLGKQSGMIGDKNTEKINHVFTRIHGDLERDYNEFLLEPEYWSQGPGNYRDINQNRRLDVLLKPELGDFNIKLFLSLVQADGYNPLTVAGTLFKVSAAKVDALVDSLELIDPLKTGMREKIIELLSERPWRPGSLFKSFRLIGAKFSLNNEKILEKVMYVSQQEFAAKFNQNGFWTDHWTYILDHVDSYLSVYPDKESAMLWEQPGIPFFMSPAYIKPRSERYQLAVEYEGQASYNAERLREMREIRASDSYLEDETDAFRVPIVTKLLMIAILKLSALDPQGMGVEMEGGKPGWNDAMNGLPGLLGSGMAETFECKRLVHYLHGALNRQAHNNAEINYVTVPLEFDEFLVSVKGETKNWKIPELLSLLESAESKLDIGITKAMSASTHANIAPSYFWYDCTKFKERPQKQGEELHVDPLSFSTRALPLFLEGPVRHLKTLSSEDVSAKREIYKAVKGSDLYDQELQMFRISQSLHNLSPNIGRVAAFASGWLENQSIWLHMSYKFYLELIRGGLYEEFYTEIRSGLVPFMNAEVYGRPLTEAASFIVSSAFSDARLHGAAFLARLSGSTAEFLSMWACMFIGTHPFQIRDNSLIFEMKPALPSWMFKEDNTVSFTFLGTTDVTIHNPARIDTWKQKPVKVSVVEKKHGSRYVSEINGSVLQTEMALKVRNGAVEKIDIYYSEKS